MASNREFPSKAEFRLKTLMVTNILINHYMQLNLNSFDFYLFYIAEKTIRKVGLKDNLENNVLYVSITIRVLSRKQEIAAQIYMRKFLGR